MFFSFLIIEYMRFLKRKTKLIDSDLLINTTRIKYSNLIMQKKPFVKFYKRMISKAILFLVYKCTMQTFLFGGYRYFIRRNSRYLTIFFELISQNLPTTVFSTVGTIKLFYQIMDGVVVTIGNSNPVLWLIAYNPVGFFCEDSSEWSLGSSITVVCPRIKRMNCGLWYKSIATAAHGQFMSCCFVSDGA